jgi:predicted transcriptional regulator
MKVSSTRYAVWGMARLETLKKGAASGDMPRVSARSFRSEDSLMRLLTADSSEFMVLLQEREPAELKHLIRRRKRKQL